MPANKEKTPKDENAPGALMDLKELALEADLEATQNETSASVNPFEPVLEKLGW